MELLADEKIPSDTASLKALSLNYQISEEHLQRAVLQLGADQFAKRQQAQADILLMGREVLPMIKKLPVTGGPEVCLRLADIVKILETNDRCSKDQLLRVAVIGLLHERENPGVMHNSRRMYVEMFQKPTDSLLQGYRGMSFVSQGLDGKVSDGLLRMTGNKHDGDKDHRLLFDAKSITGAEKFPDRFRIDVKLGGDAGGEGSYHIGVSVGNVRALFHPGFATGAFRFQRVDDKKPITPNQGMGFTPSNKLMQMSLEVAMLEGGMVKLDVTVKNEKKVFRTSWKVAVDVIGKLDHISLDRSGQTGGDANFDDLLIEFEAPR